MQASMNELVQFLEGRDDGVHQPTENSELMEPRSPSSREDSRTISKQLDDSNKLPPPSYIEELVFGILGISEAEQNTAATSLCIPREVVPPERPSDPKPFVIDGTNENFGSGWDESLLESDYDFACLSSYAQEVVITTETQSSGTADKEIANRMVANANDYSLDVLAQEKLDTQGFQVEEALQMATTPTVMCKSVIDTLQEDSTFFEDMGFDIRNSTELKDCKAYYESSTSEINTEASPEDVSRACSNLHIVPMSDGMMEVTSSPPEEFAVSLNRNGGVEIAQVSSPDVAKVPISPGQPMTPPTCQVVASTSQRPVLDLSTCCGANGAVVKNQIVLACSGDPILSENESLDSQDFGMPELVRADDPPPPVADQIYDTPPDLDPVDVPSTKKGVKTTTSTLASAAGEDLLKSGKKITLGILPETIQEATSQEELNDSLGKIVPSFTPDISNQIPAYMNEIYDVRNISLETGCSSTITNSTNQPLAPGSLPLLPVTEEQKTYKKISPTKKTKPFPVKSADSCGVDKGFVRDLLRSVNGGPSSLTGPNCVVEFTNKAPVKTVIRKDLVVGISNVPEKHLDSSGNGTTMANSSPSTSTKHLCSAPTHHVSPPSIVDESNVKVDLKSLPDLPSLLEISDVRTLDKVPSNLGTRDKSTVNPSLQRRVSISDHTVFPNKKTLTERSKKSDSVSQVVKKDASSAVSSLQKTTTIIADVAEDSVTLPQMVEDIKTKKSTLIKMLEKPVISTSMKVSLPISSLDILSVKPAIEKPKRIDGNCKENTNVILGVSTPTMAQRKQYAAPTKERDAKSLLVVGTTNAKKNGQYITKNDFNAPIGKKLMEDEVSKDKVKSDLINPSEVITTPVSSDPTKKPSINTSLRVSGKTCMTNENVGLSLNAKVIKGLLEEMNLTRRPVDLYNKQPETYNMTPIVVGDLDTPKKSLDVLEQFPKTLFGTENSSVGENIVPNKIAATTTSHGKIEEQAEGLKEHPVIDVINSLISSSKLPEVFEELSSSATSIIEKQSVPQSQQREEVEDSTTPVVGKQESKSRNHTNSHKIKSSHGVEPIKKAAAVRTADGQKVAASEKSKPRDSCTGVEVTKTSLAPSPFPQEVSNEKKRVPTRVVSKPTNKPVLDKRASVSEGVVENPVALKSQGIEQSTNQILTEDLDKLKNRSKISSSLEDIAKQKVVSPKVVERRRTRSSLDLSEKPIATQGDVEEHQPKPLDATRVQTSASRNFSDKSRANDVKEKRIVLENVIEKQKARLLRDQVENQEESHLKELSKIPDMTAEIVQKRKGTASQSVADKSQITSLKNAVDQTKQKDMAIEQASQKIETTTSSGSGLNKKTESSRTLMDGKTQASLQAGKKKTSTSEQLKTTTPHAQIANKKTTPQNPQLGQKEEKPLVDKSKTADETSSSLPSAAEGCKKQLQNSVVEKKLKTSKDNLEQKVGTHSKVEVLERKPVVDKAPIESKKASTQQGMTEKSRETAHNTVASESPLTPTEVSKKKKSTHCKELERSMEIENTKTVSSSLPTEVKISSAIVESKKSVHSRDVSEQKCGADKLKTDVARSKVDVSKISPDQNTVEVKMKKTTPEAPEKKRVLEMEATKTTREVSEKKKVVQSKEVAAKSKPAVDNLKPSSTVVVADKIIAIAQKAEGKSKEELLGMVGDTKKSLEDSEKKISLAPSRDEVVGISTKDKSKLSSTTSLDEKNMITSQENKLSKPKLPKGSVDTSQEVSEKKRSQAKEVVVREGSTKTKSKYSSLDKVKADDNKIITSHHVDEKSKLKLQKETAVISQHAVENEGGSSDCKNSVAQRTSKSRSAPSSNTAETEKNKIALPLDLGEISESGLHEKDATNTSNVTEKGKSNAQSVEIVTEKSSKDKSKSSSNNDGAARGKITSSLDIATTKPKFQKENATNAQKVTEKEKDNAQSKKVFSEKPSKGKLKLTAVADKNKISPLDDHLKSETKSQKENALNVNAVEKEKSSAHAKVVIIEEPSNTKSKRSSSSSIAESNEVAESLDVEEKSKRKSQKENVAISHDVAEKDRRCLQSKQVAEKRPPEGISTPSSNTAVTEKNKTAYANTYNMTEEEIGNAQAKEVVSERPSKGKPKPSSSTPEAEAVTEKNKTAYANTHNMTEEEKGNAQAKEVVSERPSKGKPKPSSSTPEAEAVTEKNKTAYANTHNMTEEEKGNAQAKEVVSKRPSKSKPKPSSSTPEAEENRMSLSVDMDKNSKSELQKEKANTSPKETGKEKSGAQVKEVVAEEPSAVKSKSPSNTAVVERNDFATPNVGNKSKQKLQKNATTSHGVVEKEKNSCLTTNQVGELPSKVELKPSSPVVPTEKMNVVTQPVISEKLKGELNDSVIKKSSQTLVEGAVKPKKGLAAEREETASSKNIVIQETTTTETSGKIETLVQKVDDSESSQTPQRKFKKKGVQPEKVLDDPIPSADVPKLAPLTVVSDKTETTLPHVEIKLKEKLLGGIETTEMKPELSVKQKSVLHEEVEEGTEDVSRKVVVDNTNEAKKTKGEVRNEGANEIINNPKGKEKTNVNEIVSPKLSPTKVVAKRHKSPSKAMDQELKSSEIIEKPKPALTRSSGDDNGPKVKTVKNDTSLKKSKSSDLLVGMVNSRTTKMVHTARQLSLESVVIKQNVKVDKAKKPTLGHWRIVKQDKEATKVDTRSASQSKIDDGAVVESKPSLRKRSGTSIDEQPSGKLNSAVGDSSNKAQTKEVKSAVVESTLSATKENKIRPRTRSEISNERKLKDDEQITSINPLHKQVPLDRNATKQTKEASSLKSTSSTPVDIPQKMVESSTKTSTKQNRKPVDVKPLVQTSLTENEIEASKIRSRTRSETSIERKGRHSRSSLDENKKETSGTNDSDAPTNPTQDVETVEKEINSPAKFVCTSDENDKTAVKNETKTRLRTRSETVNEKKLEEKSSSQSKSSDRKADQNELVAKRGSSVDKNMTPAKDGVINVDVPSTTRLSRCDAAHENSNQPRLRTRGERSSEKKMKKQDNSRSKNQPLNNTKIVPKSVDGERISVDDSMKVYDFIDDDAPSNIHTIDQFRNLTGKSVKNKRSSLPTSEALELDVVDKIKTNNPSRKSRSEKTKVVSGKKSRKLSPKKIPANKDDCSIVSEKNDIRNSSNDQKCSKSPDRVSSDVGKEDGPLSSSSGDHSGPREGAATRSRSRDLAHEESTTSPTRVLRSKVKQPTTSIVTNSMNNRVVDADVDSKENPPLPDAISDQRGKANCKTVHKSENSCGKCDSTTVDSVMCKHLSALSKNSVQKIENEDVDITMSKRKTRSCVKQTDKIGDLSDLSHESCPTPKENLLMPKLRSSASRKSNILDPLANEVVFSETKPNMVSKLKYSIDQRDKVESKKDFVEHEDSLSGALTLKTEKVGNDLKIIIKRVKKSSLGEKADSSITCESEAVPKYDREATADTVSKDKLKPLKSVVLDLGSEVLPNQSTVLSPQDNTVCNAEAVSLKTPPMGSIVTPEPDNIQAVNDMSQHREPEGAKSSTRTAQLRSLVLPERSIHSGREHVTFQRDKDRSEKKKLSREDKQWNMLPTLGDLTVRPLTQSPNSPATAEIVKQRSSNVSSRNSSPSKVPTLQSNKLDNLSITDGTNSENEGSSQRRVTRSCLSSASDSLPKSSKKGDDKRGSRDARKETGKRSRTQFENTLGVEDEAPSKTKSRKVDKNPETTVLQSDSSKMSTSIRSKRLNNASKKEQPHEGVISRKSYLELKSVETSYRISSDQDSSIADVSLPKEKAKKDSDANLIHSSSAQDPSKKDVPLETIFPVISSPVTVVDNLVNPETQQNPEKSSSSRRKSKSFPPTKRIPSSAENSSTSAELLDNGRKTSVEEVCMASESLDKILREEDIKEVPSNFDVLAQSPGKSPDSTTNSRADNVISKLAQEPTTVNTQKMSEDSQGVTSTTEIENSLVVNTQLVLMPEEKILELGQGKKEDEGVSSTTVDSKIYSILYSDSKLSGSKKKNMIKPSHSKRQSIEECSTVRDKQTDEEFIVETPPSKHITDLISNNSADLIVFPVNVIRKQVESTSGETSDEKPEYDVRHPRRKIWRLKTDPTKPDDNSVKVQYTSSEASIVKSMSDEELKTRDKPLKKRQVWGIQLDDKVVNVEHGDGGPKKDDRAQDKAESNQSPPACWASNKIVNVENSDVGRRVEDKKVMEKSESIQSPTSTVDQLRHSIVNILSVGAADKKNPAIQKADSRSLPREVTTTTRLRNKKQSKRIRSTCSTKSVSLKGGCLRRKGLRKSPRSMTSFPQRNGKMKLKKQIKKQKKAKKETVVIENSRASCELPQIDKSLETTTKFSERKESSSLNIATTVLPQSNLVQNNMLITSPTKSPSSLLCNDNLPRVSVECSAPVAHNYKELTVDPCADEEASPDYSPLRPPEPDTVSPELPFQERSNFSGTYKPVTTEWNNQCNSGTMIVPSPSSSGGSFIVSPQVTPVPRPITERSRSFSSSSRTSKPRTRRDSHPLPVAAQSPIPVDLSFRRKKTRTHSSTVHPEGLMISRNFGKLDLNGKNPMFYTSYPGDVVTFDLAENQVVLMKPTPTSSSCNPLWRSTDVRANEVAFRKARYNQSKSNCLPFYPENSYKLGCANNLNPMVHPSMLNLSGNLPEWSYKNERVRKDDQSLIVLNKEALQKVVREFNEGMNSMKDSNIVPNNKEFESDDGSSQNRTRLLSMKNVNVSEFGERNFSENHAATFSSASPSTVEEVDIASSQLSTGGKDAKLDHGKTVITEKAKLDHGKTVITEKAKLDHGKTVITEKAGPLSQQSKPNRLCAVGPEGAQDSETVLRNLPLYDQGVNMCNVIAGCTENYKKPAIVDEVIKSSVHNEQQVAQNCSVTPIEEHNVVCSNNYVAKHPNINEISIIPIESCASPDSVIDVVSLPTTESTYYEGQDESANTNENGRNKDAEEQAMLVTEIQSSAEIAEENQGMLVTNIQSPIEIAEVAPVKKAMLLTEVQSSSEVAKLGESGENKAMLVTEIPSSMEIAEVAEVKQKIPVKEIQNSDGIDEVAEVGQAMLITEIQSSSEITEVASGNQTILETDVQSSAEITEVVSGEPTILGTDIRRSVEITDATADKQTELVTEIHSYAEIPSLSELCVLKLPQSVSENVEMISKMDQNIINESEAAVNTDLTSPTKEAEAIDIEKPAVLLPESSLVQLATHEQDNISNNIKETDVHITNFTETNVAIETENLETTQNHSKPLQTSQHLETSVKSKTVSPIENCEVLLKPHDEIQGPMESAGTPTVLPPVSSSLTSIEQNLELPTDPLTLENIDHSVSLKAARVDIVQSGANGNDSCQRVDSMKPTSNEETDLIPVIEFQSQSKKKHADKPTDQEISEKSQVSTDNLPLSEGTCQKIDYISSKPVEELDTIVKPLETESQLQKSEKYPTSDIVCTQEVSEDGQSNLISTSVRSSKSDENLIDVSERLLGPAADKSVNLGDTSDELCKGSSVGLDPIKDLKSTNAIASAELCCKVDVEIETPLPIEQASKVSELEDPITSLTSQKTHELTALPADPCVEVIKEEVVSDHEERSTSSLNTSTSIENICELSKSTNSSIQSLTDESISHNTIVSTNSVSNVHSNCEDHIGRMEGMDQRNVDERSDTSRIGFSDSRKRKLIEYYEDVESNKSFDSPTCLIKRYKQDRAKVRVRPISPTTVDEIVREGMKINHSDLRDIVKCWQKYCLTYGVSRATTVGRAASEEISKISGRETNSREESRRPAAQSRRFEDDLSRPSTSRDLQNEPLRSSSPLTSLRYPKYVTASLLEREKDIQRVMLSNSRVGESFARGVKIHQRDCEVKHTRVESFASSRRSHSIADALSTIPSARPTVHRSYSWILEHLRERRKKMEYIESMNVQSCKDFINGVSKDAIAGCQTTLSLAVATHSRLSGGSVPPPVTNRPPIDLGATTITVISSDSEDGNPTGSEHAMRDRDEVRKRVRRKVGSSVNLPCSCQSPSQNSNCHVCPTCRKEKSHAHGASSPVRSSSTSLYTKVSNMQRREPERVMECAAAVGGGEETVIVPDSNSFHLLKALMTLAGRRPPSSDSFSPPYSLTCDDPGPSSHTEVFSLPYEKELVSTRLTVIPEPPPHEVSPHPLPETARGSTTRCLQEKLAPEEAPCIFEGTENNLQLQGEGGGEFRTQRTPLQHATTPGPSSLHLDYPTFETDDQCAVVQPSRRPDPVSCDSPSSTSQLHHSQVPPTEEDDFSSTSNSSEEANRLLRRVVGKLTPDLLVEIQRLLSGEPPSKKRKE
ncbi:hypothetical protein GE061_015015 [Apolygus lucorum]|uniref:Uncharacterized protein n=1 Tax=Apolygus lucorum TaxID=248454 RepID=A0A8S9XJP0_APOLU|nr:hypothetical protein GE061_015015 [Apolygus lucorum]